MEQIKTWEDRLEDSPAGTFAEVCKAEEIAELRTALAAAKEKWFSIATAPKDGTMLRLLVQFSDNATEDSTEPCWTIGANSKAHTDIDTWQFAGWNWQQDCFTEGVGVPIGWLPMLYYHPVAPEPPTGLIMPEAAWNDYATLSGLLNEHGVATDRAKTQTAYFAYQAAWNSCHAAFSAYIARKQPVAPELSDEQLRALPEYSRVREEFDIVAQIGEGADCASAMLVVDSLLRTLIASIPSKVSPVEPSESVQFLLNVVKDAIPMLRAANFTKTADVLEVAAREVAAPVEPVSEDKRDAERYRWLRDPETIVGYVIDKETSPGYWDYRSGDELDGAIDAAILAQQAKPTGEQQ